MGLVREVQQVPCERLHVAEGDARLLACRAQRGSPGGGAGITPQTEEVELGQVLTRVILRHDGSPLSFDSGYPPDWSAPAPTTLRCPYDQTTTTIRPAKPFVLRVALSIGVGGKDGHMDAGTSTAHGRLSVRARPAILVGGGRSVLLSDQGCQEQRA